MNANTDTTIALPTRQTRPAPSRLDPCPAACRPESRRKTDCEPGIACRPSSRDDRRCRTPQPATQPDAASGHREPNAESANPTTPEPTTTDRASAPAKRWTPGSNRCRPPITNGPPAAPDDRPAPVNHAPNPRPRVEDEWSPGRMRGVTKPGWAGKFASKLRGESGMSTAEYAVGTLAAVAFAGVLLKVVTSGTVQTALSALIEKALS